MEQKLKENINLLIQDGKKFEKINFSILFSLHREDFYSHLGNYIAFYNQTLLVAKQHKEIRLTELHFENYSNYPIMFLMQWSYIKQIKRNIRTGVTVFEKLVQE